MKKISILIAGIVIIVIGILIFTREEQVDPIEGEIAFFVTHASDTEDYFVYNTSDNLYRPFEVEAEKKTTFYVLNGKDDVESIYVMISNQDGELVAEEKFAKNQKHYKIEFQQKDAETYEVSFVLMKKDGMEFYVSSQERFLDIISDSRVENQAVNFLSNICVENNTEDTIHFCYPFVWNLGSCSFDTDKALHFSGEQTGTMYIHNQDSPSFTTGSITCDTPQWNYEMEKIFGEFAEEHYYYVKANCVNDKQIDITSLYIDSQEKLDGILEKIKTDETQTFYQFALPEEVTSVQIAGDYELGTITTEKELKLELTGNSHAVFDAANIELLWNGETAPSFEYMEQYMNVKTYNGQATDVYLGGTGDDMLLSGSVKLSAGKASAFIIDGNYITLYTGYADRIALEDAELSCELLAEGTAKIVKNDGNYYCVITNAEEKSWGYRIYLKEKEYYLPVVRIETENNVPITSKETKINGTFSLDYNGTENYENVDYGEMVIRGRGNSSWKLEKKPYKIKFEEKVSLFGLTAAKEWVLQANHADKSLIRNKLAMDMGNVLDNVLFTPHSYNVDVFVNGTYMGVYTLTEQIEVKDGRVEGEKDGTAVDTDYLVELGGESEETSFGTNLFHTILYAGVEIKNPDTDVLSKEQYEFIKEYMEQADTAAKELNGYEEYIDIPSLIDWFLLTEFTYNLDGAFRRSDYIMKKTGDKLYMATYWDFDYAFGNFWRDVEPFDEWICLGNEMTAEDNYITDNWITFLLEDPKFVMQLKERWNEVGNKLYNTAMATINEAENTVSASAEENFAKWPGVLGNKIQYELSATANISTYKGQLQYLRNFIKKRYEWMDITIRNM